MIDLDRYYMGGRRDIAIVAIGNNCVDIYEKNGAMFPGGECANVAAYCGMLGATKVGFIGMFGDDEKGDFMKKALSECGVDISHCKTFEGENGYTKVDVENGERIFVDRNYGGVQRYHAFEFTEEDLEYIKSFSMIMVGIHGHTDEVLPVLKSTGVPIAMDLSTERSESYIARIAPYVDIVMFSCVDLGDLEREELMEKTMAMGIKGVIGTIGARGSYFLANNNYLFAPAEEKAHFVDTLGAGDAYFAAFLCDMLRIDEGDSDIKNRSHLLHAMGKGAEFAATICCTEGTGWQPKASEEEEEQ